MLGEQAGLPLVLDRRAPLPRRVLALLDARRALRHDRGARPSTCASATACGCCPSRTTTRSARPRRPRSSTSCRDGRVEFGTGRSSTRAELEGFGADPDLTRAQWEEGLRMVVGAWTEDPFEWHGEHWNDARPAACTRSRSSSPTRRCGSRPSSRAEPRARRRARARAAVVHDRRAARGARRAHQALPRRADRLRSRSASSRTSARRRSRWCTARTPTSRRTRRRAESFEWYVRTALWHIGTVAEWQRGQAARHLRLRRGARRTSTWPAHVRLPQSVGRVRRRRPGALPRDRHAATRPPTAICCSACSTRTRSPTKR